MLSTASAVDLDVHYGQSAKYDLCPSLLSVSKQVKAETESILYGCNIFYAAPVHDCYEVRSVKGLAGGEVLTPLTRYLTGDLEEVHSLAGHSSMKKVRHWRVVIPVYYASGYLPNSLYELCRAVARLQPETIDLIVLPKGVEAASDSEYRPLKEILKPFSMLRGAQNVSIRDAEVKDIPEGVMRSAAWRTGEQIDSHLAGQEAFTDELLRSIKSDDPVELASEMYPPLLRYAQAFENSHSFEDDMEEQNYSLRYCYECGPDEDYLTPFRILQGHPVEAAIRRAKAATIQNDTKALKEARSFVVEYLEPQYRRIVSASRKIAEFVKSEKTKYGLFDPNPEARYSPYWKRLWPGKDCIYSVAIILLEEYVELFKRDLPFEIKVQVRANRKLFEEKYACTKRNRIMKQLEIAIEHSDFENFEKVYKEGVDDADGQYLEIRAARKCLLDCDFLGETGCIDTTLGLYDCDENIEWDIIEPKVTPLTESENKRENNRTDRLRIGRQGQ